MINTPYIKRMDRLNTLIHFMEQKNPKINMDNWVTKCGTVCCALGWACTIPALNKLGLCYGFDDYSQCPIYNDRHGISAGMNFFGMDPNTARDLFYPPLSNNNEPIKTGRDWAEFARKCIRSIY